jgi:hypothetical protein
LANGVLSDFEGTHTFEVVGSVGVGAGSVGPGPNDTGWPTPGDTGTPTPSATPVTEPSGYVRPADDPGTVRQSLTCDSGGFERQGSFEDAGWQPVGGSTTDDPVL